jgi:site-specific DNA-methyltransferase (adenine-specific)
MPDNSVDSVVTDPPYGLSFMGKKWDYDVPSEEIWRECLRVLKPGGHLLAFAGTRTQHRMAVRIEDAGFEIRDMIAWVYGSGFPKSLDVSKAIDKAEGHWRGRAGEVASENGAMSGRNYARTPKGDPITNSAKQWQGWGTALKPALEPITVARKPLGEKTVAANVLAHGTGGINVDGCRVGTDSVKTNRYTPGRDMTSFHGSQAGNEYVSSTHEGRWPANLIHDGSDEVVGLFPSDKQGSASRFFYVAKASKKDRDEGCDGLAEVPRFNGGLAGASIPLKGSPMPVGRNNHPTVKPTALMRYLCRLVTPPEGIVLDPFMGSGSTGKAAMLEGFQFIGIERDEEYMEIAKARIGAAFNEHA